MSDGGQNDEVSAEIPDWSREQPRRFWDPSRKLLRAIRRYQHWRNRGGLLAPLICRWFQLCHQFWSTVTGADIPLNTTLGGGLMIPHPNGIVFHPMAQIGVNCLIFQQVTISTSGICAKPGAPVLGGHVDVGAGAKILGPINVGAHALVGANAVLITDLPSRATAVGIPAKVVEG